MTDLAPSILVLVGTVAGGLIGIGGALAKQWLARKDQREEVMRLKLEHLVNACFEADDRIREEIHYVHNPGTRQVPSRDMEPASRCLVLASLYYPQLKDDALELAANY